MGNAKAAWLRLKNRAEYEGIGELTYAELCIYTTWISNGRITTVAIMGAAEEVELYRSIAADAGKMREPIADDIDEFGSRCILCGVWTQESAESAKIEHREDCSWRRLSELSKRLEVKHGN